MSSRTAYEVKLDLGAKCSNAEIQPHTNHHHLSVYVCGSNSSVTTAVHGEVDHSIPLPVRSD